MRLLYTVLLYLITPLVLLRLLWKSRLQPEYRRRVGERFGLVAPADGGVAVWVHAVSVGESLAALPLIEALIRRHGEGRVWVTTTTPTGSERVQAALGHRVRHSYAPYDLPGSVARFLERARPRHPQTRAAATGGQRAAVAALVPWLRPPPPFHRRRAGRLHRGGGAERSR